MCECAHGPSESMITYEQAVDQDMGVVMVGAMVVHCATLLWRSHLTSANLWHLTVHAQVHSVKVISMSLNRQSALLLSRAALLVSFAFVLGCFNFNTPAAVFLHT